MADDRDEQTLRALQAMQSCAAPSGDANDDAEVYSIRPAPEPPQRPKAALPPSGPPSSANYAGPSVGSPRRQIIGEQAESPRRCLHCGYFLAPQGGGQCSECGKQFAESVLERWFGGSEQGRLEKVRWLIAALLFAKIWFWMPYVGGYANFIATLVAGFALYVANEDKADSMAGLYALGAGIASLLGLCMSTLAVTPYYYFVDLAVAGLVLAVILTDGERFEVLGQFSMKMFAFIMLFSAPVLGVIHNAVVQAFKAAGASSAILDGFALAIPFALNVIGWGYVLWCVHFIYRTLFHADVLDES